MKLDQFLKWKDMVTSGGEAKTFIKSGSVKVNGVIETRRGRKLKKGDKVKYKVLEIDAEKERVALGIKQLEKDTFSEAVKEKLKKGKYLIKKT